MRAAHAHLEPGDEPGCVAEVIPLGRQVADQPQAAAALGQRVIWAFQDGDRRAAGVADLDPGTVRAAGHGDR